jgi:hypothetical protein
MVPAMPPLLDPSQEDLVAPQPTVSDSDSDSDSNRDPTQRGHRLLAAPGHEPKPRIAGPKRRTARHQCRSFSRPGGLARSLLACARLPHVAATAFVWLCVIVAASLLGACGQTASLGFETVRAGDDTRLFQVENLLGIQFPLSVLSGLVVFASDTVRDCLLADSDLSVGRLVLTALLVLSSLPFHLFSNSMFFVAEPAHDAYEIMVSHDFFNGKAPNITSLNMTQFADQAAAPEPFNTSWPDAWPDASLLQQKLLRLQEDPSQWHNLSNTECRTQYGTDTYTSFRNVILVTNWTAHLPADNSALAIGSLPGYVPGGVSDRLLALCPAAYLSHTPGSFVPASAPYLQLADENQCRVAVGQSPIPCTTYPAALHQSWDLCYAYRNESGYGVTDAWNASLALRLAYCLSEPLTDAPTRVVFNRFAALVFVCFAAAQALLMTALCALVGPRRVDIAKTPSDKDEVFGSSALQAKYALLLPEFILWCVVYYSGLGAFGDGRAVVQTDATGSWVMGIAAYANALQLVYALMGFFEGLWANHRVFRGGTIPAKVAFFVWNQLVQRAAAAFVSVVMVQRYRLGAGDDSGAPYQTVVTLSSLITDTTGMKNLQGGGSKSGWFWLLVLMYLAVRTLLGICLQAGFCVD